MPMRAHGTATLAFLASSLRCVVESNAPTAQRGARKLSRNAKPSGQPDTAEVRIDILDRTADAQLSKPPKAYAAVFLNSFGVATGRATITTRASLFETVNLECVLDHNQETCTIFTVVIRD